MLYLLFLFSSGVWDSGVFVASPDVAHIAVGFTGFGRVIAVDKAAHKAEFIDHVIDDSELEVTLFFEFFLLGGEPAGGFGFAQLEGEGTCAVEEFVGEDDDLFEEGTPLGVVEG